MSGVVKHYVLRNNNEGIVATARPAWVRLRDYSRHNFTEGVAWVAQAATHPTWRKSLLCLWALGKPRFVSSGFRLVEYRHRKNKKGAKQPFPAWIEGNFTPLPKFARVQQRIPLAAARTRIIQHRIPQVRENIFAGAAERALQAMAERNRARRERQEAQATIVPPNWPAGGGLEGLAHNFAPPMPAAPNPWGTPQTTANVPQETPTIRWNIGYELTGVGQTAQVVPGDIETDDWTARR